MSLPVRFAPVAQEDLDRIWQYLAQFGGDLGDRAIDRIASSTDRLREHPFSGPAIGQRGAGLRRVSAHRYVIIYMVRNEDVLVVRVFDARQDWQRELGGRQ